MNCGCGLDLWAALMKVPWLVQKPFTLMVERTGRAIFVKECYLLWDLIMREKLDLRCIHMGIELKGLLLMFFKIGIRVSLVMIGTDLHIILDKRGMLSFM